MAIFRLAPYPEIDGLHKEMNRLFESLLPTVPHQRSASAFMPAVEMHETADAVELKLELPGINPKDLDIRVSEKSVAIKGERKTQSEVTKNGFSRSEFHYGSFQRVVPLPTRMINDQTKADYKDGILTLTLPKAEGDKQKTFKVELG